VPGRAPAWCGSNYLSSQPHEAGELGPPLGAAANTELTAEQISSESLHKSIIRARPQGRVDLADPRGMRGGLTISCVGVRLRRLHSPSACCPEFGARFRQPTVRLRGLPAALLLLERAERAICRSGMFHGLNAVKGFLAFGDQFGKFELALGPRKRVPLLNWI